MPVTRPASSTITEPAAPVLIREAILATSSAPTAEPPVGPVIVGAGAVPGCDGQPIAVQWPPGDDASDAVVMSRLASVLRTAMSDARASGVARKPVGFGGDR
jgi:hypothetical protein